MFSVFLDSPSPGPLARERRFLLGHFFSSSKCGISEAKKTQWTHHHVVDGSQDPSLVSLLLSIFQSFMPVWYIMSAFSVVLSGGNREKHVYSIFLEAEIWTSYLKKYLLISLLPGTIMAKISCICPMAG